MKLNMAPITVAGIVSLALINIGLGISLLRGELTEPHPDFEKRERTMLSAPVTEEIRGKPAHLYSESLARPVFFKTRQPYIATHDPEPTALRSTPAPPVNPGFAVAGILIERENRKAYLLTKGELEGTWVREGELFRGWRVKSVDDGAVKLQQQNQIIEVLLYASPKS